MSVSRRSFAIAAVALGSTISGRRAFGQSTPSNEDLQALVESDRRRLLLSLAGEKLLNDTLIAVVLQDESVQTLEEIGGGDTAASIQEYSNWLLEFRDGRHSEAILSNLKNPDVSESIIETSRSESQMLSDGIEAALIRAGLRTEGDVAVDPAVTAATINALHALSIGEIERPPFLCRIFPFRRFCAL